MINTENATHPKKRARKHVLGASGTYRLSSWMVENWDRIIKTRWTKTETCQVAGAAMGFQVTCGNLDTALKAIEREWPSGRGSTGGGNGTRGFGVARQARTALGRTDVLLDVLCEALRQMGCTELEDRLRLDFDAASVVRETD